MFFQSKPGLAYSKAVMGKLAHAHLGHLHNCTTPVFFLRTGGGGGGVDPRESTDIFRTLAPLTPSQLINQSIKRAIKLSTVEGK